MKQNFFRCGILGWAMEIFWTGLHSFRVRDPKLTGTSSLWMFPIYGCAAFLAPLMRRLRRYAFWQRGLIYIVSDLSGRIHQRQSAESARHVSLELWTESISDPRSHPSGFCPALVSGRSSVRANDKSFKNKLNFPPVSCILMGRARPLSVRLY